MIIFDIDGTLADLEHRRHFVDPRNSNDYFQAIRGEGMLSKSFYYHKVTKERWQSDWKSFYEACDQDNPIQPVIDMFQHCVTTQKAQIWSGRCESVREKTLQWLDKFLLVFLDDFELKMRPIGDNTPDDELKERWLDEYVNDLYPPLVKCGDGAMDGFEYKRNSRIEFVFDSDHKSIAMWRRRGIFVFKCCQHDQVF